MRSNLVCTLESPQYYDISERGMSMKFSKQENTLKKIFSHSQLPLGPCYSPFPNGKNQVTGTPPTSHSARTENIFSEE